MLEGAQGARARGAPMSLAQHVGHFSTSLRGFSEHVSGGVDELRRCANARACNGRAPHPQAHGLRRRSLRAEIPHVPAALTQLRAHALPCAAARSPEAPVPRAAAAVFRESCEELAQQAAAISAQVSQLEGVTLDAVSLEARPRAGLCGGAA